jgi:hypothetical protein
MAAIKRPLKREDDPLDLGWLTAREQVEAGAVVSPNHEPGQSDQQQPRVVWDDARDGESEDPLPGQAVRSLPVGPGGLHQQFVTVRVQHR